MDERSLRRYFEERGFHVGDGLKYGADLLLYTDSPNRVHSKYAVLIDRNHTFLQIIAAQRVCNSSKKILILASADSDGKIVLTSIERFTGAGNKREPPDF